MEKYNTVRLAKTNGNTSSNMKRSSADSIDPGSQVSSLTGKGNKLHSFEDSFFGFLGLGDDEEIVSLLRTASNGTDHVVCTGDNLSLNKYELVGGGSSEGVSSNHSEAALAVKPACLFSEKEQKLSGTCTEEESSQSWATSSLSRRSNTNSVCTFDLMSMASIPLCSIDNLFFGFLDNDSAFTGDKTIDGEYSLTTQSATNFSSKYSVNATEKSEKILVCNSHVEEDPSSCTVGCNNSSSKSSPSGAFKFVEKSDSPTSSLLPSVGLSNLLQSSADKKILADASKKFSLLSPSNEECKKDHEKEFNTQLPISTLSIPKNYYEKPSKDNISLANSIKNKMQYMIDRRSARFRDSAMYIRTMYSDVEKYDCSSEIIYEDSVVYKKIPILKPPQDEQNRNKSTFFRNNKKLSIFGHTNKSLLQ